MNLLIPTFQFIGGLALFLFGMEIMSDGLKKTAGNKLRGILAALTRNRVFALGAGAFVTMLIQSSSATTVMLVSLVQAQLMTFTQTLGVILGADIGTTVTAQLIAFKLTDHALGFAALGYGLKLFGKTDRMKDIGMAILGFGILFFGMKLMSDAMAPLRSYQGIVDMIRELENPVVGLAAGAVITGLIQSSSAFTGIVIVLAQQGFVTLEAGIPLIFGANIGTCITAGIAAVGTSRDAKRVALAHVLFKVFGVLLFLPWIPVFETVVVRFSAFFGAMDPARHIANAHTVFNVGLALVFLPVTGLLGRLILWIYPVRGIETLPELKVWHLDDSMIRTPPIAVKLVRTEIARMSEIINKMLKAILIPFISDPELIRNNPDIPRDEKERLIREIPEKDHHYPQISLLEGIDLREKQIDFLDEKIHDYLIKIAGQKISTAEAKEVFRMSTVTNDLESIGDIIHRNMLPLLEKKQGLGAEFSMEGKEELMRYHLKVVKQISRLKEALEARDGAAAARIMAKEDKYTDLELEFRLRHMGRVVQEQEESLKTHEVHLELMDLLKQINVYTINIAKTMVSKRVPPQ